MAEQASDYHRGDQDIADQQATFHLVMGMMKWGSLYGGALVLWLTIWFCTETGFLGASVTAVVMIVLGRLLLRERKSAGH